MIRKLYTNEKITLLLICESGATASAYKKIPPETSTSMVSSQSYWLNEASNHHRANQNECSKCIWSPHVYHVAREKERFKKAVYYLAARSDMIIIVYKTRKNVYFLQVQWTSNTTRDAFEGFHLL